MKTMALAHRELDRRQAKESVKEVRRLRRELLIRIQENAPNEELRRQARFYLDRMGEPGE